MQAEVDPAVPTVDNKRIKTVESAEVDQEAQSSSVVAVVDGAAAVTSGQRGSKCWQSLDDVADKEWIDTQNRYNDERNTNAVVCYPSEMIVARKWVKVGKHFNKGGKTFVLFQRFPEKGSKDSKVVELKLEPEEWVLFEGKFEGIKEFIEAVEGKNGLNVDDCLTHESINRNLKDFMGMKQCRIVIRDNLMLTLSWNVEKKQSNVDLRRGEEVVSDKGVKFWKAGKEGICLSAGGFDYLARFLKPIINDGLRMWRDMYKFCGHLEESCLSTYVPRYYGHANGEFENRSFRRTLPSKDQAEEEDYSLHFESQWKYERPEVSPWD